ncbi:MAG: relaxase/mobilization nuclease domain-containing protein [Saccharofermentanales bacterium]
MAITKVAAIRTSISKTLNYCISKAEMVSGINCNPKEAKDQFFKTKENFNKMQGRSGYHAVQSFAPGEVTVELAHEIGLRFVDEMWADGYEVVVATHTDREHIHNHFIINSVSLIDGKKLRFPKPMNKELAVVSDRLCMEYGISVIDQDRILDHEKTIPFVHYGDWMDEQAPGISIRDRIKMDIDSLIDYAADLPDLFSDLEKLGYQIRVDGKYPALKPPYSERFIRFKSLGTNYSFEKLFLQLHNLEISRPKKNNTVIKLNEAWIIYHGLLKHQPGSFSNLLKHYQIFLRTYLAKPIVYPTAEARQSARRILNYQKEIEYIDKHKITSIEELKNLKNNINFELNKLVKDRNKLYLAKKDELPQVKIDVINHLNNKISKLRSELNLIDQIIKDVENCMVTDTETIEDSKYPEHEERRENEQNKDIEETVNELNKGEK